jgi:hypothetical protein
MVQDVIMREMGLENGAGVAPTERRTAALATGPPGLYVVSSRNAEPGMVISATLGFRKNAISGERCLGK